jgi:hypothetical protein
MKPKKLVALSNNWQTYIQKVSNLIASFCDDNNRIMGSEDYIKKKGSLDYYEYGC